MGLTQQNAVWAVMKGVDLQNGDRVPPQNNTWSSGPNMGARFLAHIGLFPKPYPEFLGDYPRTVEPIPQALVEYMNKLAEWPAFQVKSGLTSLELAIQQIKMDRPVIVLLKVRDAALSDLVPADHRKIIAELGVLAPKMPIVHYVLLNKYDSDLRLFSYVDSDGFEYTKSYDEMARQYHWTPEISLFVRELLPLVIDSKTDTESGWLEHLLLISGSTMIQMADSAAGW